MNKSATADQVGDLGAITRITVEGFKSLHSAQHIDLRNLTVLAGANSAGKSSIMQPLLLLKQTLDASYDPGALLLNGPNSRFTSTDQLFFRRGKQQSAESFTVGVDLGLASGVVRTFRRGAKQPVELAEVTLRGGDRSVTLTPTPRLAVATLQQLHDLLRASLDERGRRQAWAVERERCSFFLAFQSENGLTGSWRFMGQNESSIRRTIHLPGLRGNPERTYSVAAVGTQFPGTFEQYVASVIASLQETGGLERLAEIGNDLGKLGLTWKVSARRVNDTEVELSVGRLAAPVAGGARDLVSIADVGFGVSQVLPLVVALRVAQPGQLVFIEQPELHLHPRAQVKLAELLADAASRDVRVVAETHSALMILGIQTLIAEGKLSSELVKLHWFERNKLGETTVRSADLDERGAFGDWPEDFADVAAETESRYLDAVENRVLS